MEKGFKNDFSNIGFNKFAKMKNFKKILSIVMLLMVVSVMNARPKLVTIRLTGSSNEDIEMTVGKTGRVEVISMLPYEFKLSQEDLPVRLTFRSANYQYYNIDIPEKPVDDCGHVYLVKSKDIPVNGFAQNVSPANPQQTAPVVVKGIDTTYGVNAAPYTGAKSENTFAIIFANEEYEMATNVEMANNDGLAVKEYFMKTLGLTDKQTLYYPNATFGKMNKAMKDIKSIATAYDGKINLLIYYAGHGIPDNATKDAYLMPVDADGTDVSVCYSLKKLYNEIDEMRLNQTVVFLDACFSGAKRDGDMIVAARGVAIKAKEEKPKGTTFVFCATSDEEAAYSYKEEKHGLFTYFFLKRMQEKKEKVSLGDLADYIKENVSRQSVLINGKKQTPTIIVPDSMQDEWKKMRLTSK